MDTSAVTVFATVVVVMGVGEDAPRLGVTAVAVVDIAAVVTTEGAATESCFVLRS